MPTLCPTVLNAINDFLTSKARATRSDRYLRQLRVSLGKFAAGRSHVPLDQITLADVDEWLWGNEWAPRTMKGYLADVRGLFRFASRRGWVKDNPAAAVELPSDKSGMRPPDIHSPGEMAKVLETARLADLDVCRHLAVRYFAGLRTAEAHRIREANILLYRGWIEVPAIMAKTRRRRLVKIQRDRSQRALARPWRWPPARRWSRRGSRPERPRCRRRPSRQTPRPDTGQCSPRSCRAWPRCP